MIDESKCIRCGKCIHSCPFGAIGSKTYIVDVIDAIKSENKHVYAMVAPAAEGQFGVNITMNSWKKAMQAVGFNGFVEVALGGDMTAAYEADEWLEAYEAVDAKDLPGMTDVDASLLYFCSLVSKHNKVALTGECADEIFGGYPWFYRDDLFHANGFPWSFDLTARTAFLTDEVVNDLDLTDYSYERYLESKTKAPLLAGESKEEERRRIIGYLNIKWFMQTLLDRMDRTSMYSGLEARVPFADHRIIEYVYNVPWHMKYQNGVEKTLLRDAFCDVLPSELLHRKKSPYPKTYHPGYEKLLVSEMRHILSDTNAPIQSLVDHTKVRAFIDAPKQYGRPWFGQLMAGPQLIAYFIQINYWMEKYHLQF